MHRWSLQRRRSNFFGPSSIARLTFSPTPETQKRHNDDPWQLRKQLQDVQISDRATGAHIARETSDVTVRRLTRHRLGPFLRRSVITLQGPAYSNVRVVKSITRLMMANMEAPAPVLARRSPSPSVTAVGGDREA